MNPAALGGGDGAQASVLYMALELSNKTWKVVFGDGTKRRHITVGAGDLGQFREAVERTRARFGLVQDGRIVSCYEAEKARMMTRNAVSV